MSTERDKSAGPTPGAGAPDTQSRDNRSRDRQRAGPPRGDGRSDTAQLKRNQESLHVGDDHRTPEMKKHRRGTFP